MRKVDIKAVFSLLTSNRLNQDFDFSLNIPISNKNSAKVRIGLALKEAVVEIDNYIISEHLFESIVKHQSHLLGDYDEEVQDEINSIHLEYNKAVKEVLSHIKYFLSYYDFSENLISGKSREWRVSNGNWVSIPSSFSCTIDEFKIQQIDENLCKDIQSTIDEEIKPLLALCHLHRAKNERIPKYKWIDATIAAELAIKEILLRKKPDLEVILLDLPSPPLHKLYGSILEYYLGERSPYLKIINNGVKIRNRLVPPYVP